MHYIRYAFLLILGLMLLVVAIANRGLVTLRVLPESMAGFLGWSWSLTMPLFLVMFAGLIFGLIVGFVLEWMREHKYRSDASHQRREKERLQREMRQPPRPGAGDDVLALLGDGSAPR